MADSAKKWEVVFHGYRNSWVVKSFNWWLMARLWMLLNATKRYKLRRNEQWFSG